MKSLFFECGIEICDNPVKVKFYKEDGNDDFISGFYFELSHFLKSKEDIDVYRHPSNYGNIVIRLTMGKRWKNVFLHFVNMFLDLTMLIK